MDQLLEQIRELCTGMSVEEIQQQIDASGVAGGIDSAAMAQAIFDLCAE